MSRYAIRTNWRCSDCGERFSLEMTPPNRAMWDWAAERYCEDCAEGQILDAVTAALRKAGQALSPTLHQGVLEQVNAALVLAGERPI